MSSHKTIYIIDDVLLENIKKFMEGKSINWLATQLGICFCAAKRIIFESKIKDFRVVNKLKKYFDFDIIKKMNG